jgi:hypothetical protein
MSSKEKTLKKRRKLKVSHILILLLLVGAGAFTLYRWNLKKKLRSRIEAIRTAGYPVTGAELTEWYTIPEGAENAADVIIEAFSYYREWDKTELESLPIVGRAELPVRTEPLAEETKGLVAQYLSDNQQALELLHEGAAMEHSRYPVDLSLGLGTQMMYHFSDLRKGAMLLKLEAVLHAENDKPQAVVRSIISAFGIADSLAREPMAVSQHVRVDFQGFVVSSLEYVINRVELTDEQLVELGRVVTETEDTKAVLWALVGGRCLGIDIFKGPVSLILDAVVGDDDSIPPVPVLELYRDLGLADRDAIIYIDLMNDYIKAAKLPLCQRQKAAEIVDAKFKATSKTHIWLYKFMPMPVFSGVINMGTAGIAHLRTARLALAIQRYRLATGNLPDTLADLVPTYLDTVPKDPFDGRSLRYEKLETGFVVYSVGEDRRDDGGTERLPTGKRKKAPSSWDITFIVER